MGVDILAHGPVARWSAWTSRRERIDYTATTSRSTGRESHLWNDGDSLTLIDTRTPGSGAAIEGAITELGLLAHVVTGASARLREAARATRH